MEQVSAARNWRLTSRDEAILKHIGEYGFSSARWIKERFWAGKPNCLYYRRLSILRKLGYIEYLVGDAGKTLGYRLSKKGMAHLESNGLRDAAESEYRAAYRTNFNHDDYLVGIGTVLRSFPGIAEYWPERKVRQYLAERHGYKERRSDGYKVPDALFLLQTKQRRLRVAVELEIAPKGKDYYRRILRQLSTSTDFDLVFLISPDPTMLDRLMDTLTWVRANDPSVKFGSRRNGFYFADLSDVLSAKGNSKFRGEGTAFTLTQLAG